MCIAIAVQVEASEADAGLVSERHIDHAFGTDRIVIAILKFAAMAPIIRLYVNAIVPQIACFPIKSPRNEK